MNIDEKREALNAICDEYETCSNGCPLYEGRLSGLCRWLKTRDDDVEEITRLYNIAFPPTESTTISIIKDSGEVDMVNRPPHYITSKYECIDVMIEVFGKEYVKGFCLCNAFKYLYRCTKKHESPLEDIGKTMWYLEKFTELEKEKNDD
jgi:hypothetical protein